MTELLSKLISFILNFDAWEYLYENRKIIGHGIYVAFSIGFILTSLSFFYCIKKSEKKMKYIRKEYNIFQCILLIHWSQNLYKKVDRFWFDILHRCYLIHIFLFLIILILPFFCRYLPVLNPVTGAIYAFHVGYTAFVLIFYFL